jgi:hypothetical protein
LQTYHGGNGPREAGDSKAAQELCNGGGGDIWRCSDSKGCFGGDGAGRASSCKRRIGVGDLGKADRALFIGVLVPNRR